MIFLVTCTALIITDDESTSTVFSLAMIAFNACDEYQWFRYSIYEAPRMYLDECCIMLFEVMALNTNNGQFNPQGDRRSMFSKVCSNNGNERYLHLCNDVTLSGHINYLRIDHEMGFPWDKMLPLIAVQMGHLDCLVYAHENGCPWISQTFTCAARHGSIECLKYARNNGYE